MRRTIEIDGDTWAVCPAGRVTVYTADEFGLLFETGSGADRVRRVTRYSPTSARRPDVALAELSDAKLRELFRQSQPAWTSPVTEYTRNAP